MRADLIDYMGSDLTVVNSARVSFDKESEWEAIWDTTIEDDIIHNNSVSYVLSDKDKKLIKYLAKNGHWTPFSHVQIQMRETVPIFVARQRFKHMVGFTYNEISRRYVDDDPVFYYPDFWRKRSQDKKQGSDDERILNHSYIDDEYDEFIDSATKLYKTMLANDVAPEQARMMLPQSMFTSYYVTGSLAAWGRAYKQRVHGHAQKEIQFLAKQWDNEIGSLSELSNSWNALKE